MSRTRVLSGVLGAALLAAVAVGQPPPPAKPADAKGGLDEAIAAAVRSHPDVRVAEAEVQTAQAKLAQAKMLVARQVAAARHAKDATRRAVTAAEGQLADAEGGAKAAQAMLDRFQALGRNGVASAEVAAAEAAALTARTRMVVARTQIEQAKAEVARADAEYDALVGPGRTAAVDANSPQWIRVAGEHIVFQDQLRAWDLGAQPIKLDWAFLPLPAPAGSVADKLRAALDKPVKLPGSAPAGPGEVLAELLKAAGLDVRVKLPAAYTTPRPEAPRFTLAAGEHPLGTWLQLYADELFDATAAGGRPARRCELYVREYGLLLAAKESAPADAVTVQQFWKQARAEPAKGK